MIINNYERRNYKLHIAISPLKNPERFEWFIEKSVEIGIDEITPLICKNTEKTGIKSERINNLIVSAMKQSLKAIKTCYSTSHAVSESLSVSIPNGLRMIAHCDNRDGKTKHIRSISKNNDAIILIGPEGDFRRRN